MNTDSLIYTERIYTKDGIAKEAVAEPTQKVLHIGPGKKSLKGAITIDILSLPGVDIVHDLDTFPWPANDGEYDLIFAHNVFEHLSDQVRVMEEMWRILKPKGRIVITVPYFRCVDAFTDSTHKHFFTSGSLDYYIQSKALSEYEYTKKRFRKIGMWYGWPTRSSNPFVRFFKSFINRHSKWYDQYLSLIFPVKILVWELEVVKE
jgi:SAM-dependent methyltransferase